MKKRYLVLLLFGVILLGFGIVSLASIESIVQDRYLVAWICNILIATGTAVLYLSYAVFGMIVRLTWPTPAPLLQKQKERQRQPKS